MPLDIDSNEIACIEYEGIQPEIVMWYLKASLRSIVGLERQDLEAAFGNKNSISMIMPFYEDRKEGDRVIRTIRVRCMLENPHYDNAEEICREIRDIVRRRAEDLVEKLERSINSAGAISICHSSR